MGLSGAGKDTVAQMLQRGLVSAGATKVEIGGFADYLRDISKRIGLDPFKRETKEVPHVLSASQFEERLYDATETLFMNKLPSRDRAALWAYAMDEYEERFLRDRDATSNDPYFEISPRQFMQVLGTAGRKVRDTFWIELAQKKWHESSGIVLVTDCRFENEAALADKVLFVKRPFVSPVCPHVSERLAFHINAGIVSIPGQEIIDNGGSLEDLEREVASAAASLAVLFSAAF
jgi:hypothetical protein